MNLIPKEKVTLLYGRDEMTLPFQLKRYEQLQKRFREEFGRECEAFFSAPGRTEIGGNHTDHNFGRVLAASVNLDILCAAASRDDNRVVFRSEGYAPAEVDLDDLEPRETEFGTTVAIIRGIAAGMKAAGYRIGGFDAAVTSTVAAGSGLSSSAALEILLTAVFDGLFNRFDMPFVTRATIGQKAENRFFGKPSGLLDQMGSAAGGLVTVDFRDNDHPEVRALAYDFEAKGYAPVVVATGASHANLTPHYAAIPSEMKQIAGFFGKKVLREVTPEELRDNLKLLRERFGDRPILRALHFMEENERVVRQVQALEEDRIGDFFREIIASGRSSYMYLQNVYVPDGDQGLSLALCLAEKLLDGKGAWRVHGGGFAGTTLNFVPLDEVRHFVDVMDGVFGEGACHVLYIRPVGADMNRIG